MTDKNKTIQLLVIITMLAVIGAGGYFGYKLLKNNTVPQKSAELKIIPESVRPAAAAVETAETEDGQKVATFLSYPKYYLDEKKEWQEVKADIAKNEDKSTKLLSGEVADWKVDKGVWKFYATDDGAVAADNAGIRLETKIKALVYFDSQSKKAAVIYEAKSIRPIVNANQIIWPSIIESVDYKITYINDIMKEEIVMSAAARKKLPAPESLGIPADRAYLGFLFDRSKERTGGVTAYVADKNGRKRVSYGVKSFETEGGVEFVDEKGNKVQTIEAGFTALSAESPKQIQNSNQAQNSPSTSSGQANDQNLKQLPLLKRFYKEAPGQKNGRKLLFSGSKYEDIKNLGEGSIIFDPTIRFQRQASAGVVAVADTQTSAAIGYENNNMGTINNFSVGNNTAKALLSFENFIGTGTGQIPSAAAIKKAFFSIYVSSITTSNVATVNLMLDQWTEGNLSNLAISASGQYGATSINAQEKYNSETAYINDVSGITASSVSVTIDNGSGGGITIADWPANGLIKIDSEIMSYASRTSTSFSGLIRGINGTTAASHANNAIVYGTVAWRNINPGGSSIGSQLASFTPVSVGYYNMDITGAVQDWAINPNNNYGTLINSVSGSFGIVSSENVNIGMRPKLIVAYTASNPGQAGLLDAYESADTVVSPASPGATTTAQNFLLATEAQDSGFWTTALSTTDNGYDSQVFKMQLPIAASTSLAVINWKGHGESAPATNTTSLNIWNFNSSSWTELASGSARYNDTFTDKTAALDAATGWFTYGVYALTFDSVNNQIYIGGGSGDLNKKFARYNPSSDSFTNLSSKVDYAIMALTFDPANKEIYIGENDGRFEKYNPVTDSVTALPNWGSGSVYAMTFDSARNVVYLGGDTTKFAKYETATRTFSDLSSKISSFWGTNSIRSLTFDSADKMIYLGGASGKFARYDPATDTATDLTATLGWSGGTYTAKALVFDSSANIVYIGGFESNVKAKLSKYTPALNSMESLDSYLPATLANTGFINNLSFDPSNKTIYSSGSGATVARYFPETQTSRSLTNAVYDTIGSIQLNASAFDTTNGVLYIGGNSGKFGKYAVPSDTTLSASLTSNLQNYRDSSGYAWLWVKATNEWSPPTIPTGPSGGFAITWTTGEGADGALAYHKSVSHAAGSWSDYPNFLYESDAGWKTSHSITLPADCGIIYYYRVRSCDQWGSCTVSSENSFDTGACGGTCLHQYLWDGRKWQFETDTFAAGTLGYQKGGIKGFVVPLPHELYPLKNLVPKDGRIELRQYSDLNEINYFDRLQLLGYIVPEDRELGVENPTVGSLADTEPKLHTIAVNPLKPKSARWLEKGEDILALISERDGQKLIINPDKENYEYQTLELDFGDLSAYRQKKLIVSGASAFPDTPAGIERKKKFGSVNSLLVEDGRGGWVEVPAKKANSFSKPYSFERLQVMDISDIFISKSTKLRVKYLYKTYLDQIAFDGTDDIENLEPMELPLKKAVLSGHQTYHPFDRDGGRPDYNQLKRRDSSADFPGRYTRYGEVTELLAKRDDKFAIVAKGDEVVAYYQIPDAAVPAGFKRVYAIDTVGYHKAAGKSKVPMTVEPLPFAKMKNFPYEPKDYPYASDADYQNYLATYNTRLIDKDHQYADYLPLRERLKWKAGKLWDGLGRTWDNLKKKLERAAVNLGLKKNTSELYMHRENAPGSADTDYIEILTENPTAAIKGELRIQGGVRIGN